jgi:hypothetical protein
MYGFHYIYTDNIYVTEDGKGIILNDWSSAVYVGAETHWVGTRAYADDPVDCTHQNPSAESDLRSLVRTFYAVYVGRSPEGSASGDYSSFWNECLAPSYWSDLLASATDCNYDDLRARIAKL